MDEGRKRVIGIMAAILTAMHMRTADDLFGTPQGSPRTDKLIAASIQWAETIMEKIDNMHPEGVLKIGAGSLMYAPDATQSRSAADATVGWFPLFTLLLGAIIALISSVITSLL